MLRRIASHMLGEGDGPMDTNVCECGEEGERREFLDSYYELKKAPSTTIFSHQCCQKTEKKMQEKFSLFMSVSFFPKVDVLSSACLYKHYSYIPY